MKPKTLTTGMLQAALKLQTKKIEDELAHGKLVEAQNEVDGLIAVATELSRRISMSLDLDDGEEFSPVK